MRLSELLKARREAQNKNQKQLAEECGLDQSHISRFEVGTREPSSSQLEALAKVLGPITIGQTYTRIHSTDSVAIDIGSAKDILVFDEAGTYAFPNVKTALDWCREMVDGSAGEWWVEEYEEAVKTLEEELP